MYDFRSLYESRARELDATERKRVGREAWGGVISTFADPDGNLCQLIQYDPSRARAAG